MTIADFRSTLQALSELPSAMSAHLSALAPKMSADDRAECIRAIQNEYEGIAAEQKAIYSLIAEGEKDLRIFTRKALPGIRRAIECEGAGDPDALLRDQ